jgi:2-polyprenyl-3-methyl-5-hydroxy-6-metoxy-1,4-benzoquinol methylase
LEDKRDETMVYQMWDRILNKVLKNRRKLQTRVETNFDFSTLPNYTFLQQLMMRYQVTNLVNETPRTFHKKIEDFLNLEDYTMEGYLSPERQRDLSIKFHWGHNHDFGDFSLQGRMRNRHIDLLAYFLDKYDGDKQTLSGLRVLDIGCWTGGTSLLLAAMGAEVVAIEEVRKYVDCVNYLKHAFNISSLDVKNLSLYDCTTSEFYDSFDIVLYAGVLYHVTDPVLSLRITFNCLKDGGACFIETASVNQMDSILAYQGPEVFSRGNEGAMNRGGWNWFVPSPEALRRMIYDVGYSDVNVSSVINGRAFAIAKRTQHTEMTRAGLSVRHIK